MDLLPTAINDDTINEQQPLIRAQILRHLTNLTDLCDREIATGEDEGHVDPRFAELKLRTLDRIARLYRLWDKPQPKEQEEDTGTGFSQEQTRRMVLEQLQELEARSG